MSLYVLDTDTLSLLERGDETVHRQRIEHGLDAVVVTIISVEEQWNGWQSLLRRPQSPERQAEIYRRLTACVSFLGQLPILTFSEAALYRFEELRKLKVNVGPNDLRIAAIILEEGATLVIRNRRDFERIPDLFLEDWSVITTDA